MRVSRCLMMQTRRRLRTGARSGREAQMWILTTRTRHLVLLNMRPRPPPSSAPPSAISSTGGRNVRGRGWKTGSWSREEQRESGEGQRQRARRRGGRRTCIDVSGWSNRRKIAMRWNVHSGGRSQGVLECAVQGERCSCRSIIRRQCLLAGERGVDGVMCDGVSIWYMRCVHVQEVNLGSSPFERTTPESLFALPSRFSLSYAIDVRSGLRTSPTDSSEGQGVVSSTAPRPRCIPPIAALTAPSDATAHLPLNSPPLRHLHHGRRRRVPWRCRLLLQGRVWPQHPWAAPSDHSMHHCCRRCCEQTVLRYPLREHYPRMYVGQLILGAALPTSATHERRAHAKPLNSRPLVQLPSHQVPCPAWIRQLLGLV
jgi:hypothetical protein